MPLSRDRCDSFGSSGGFLAFVEKLAVFDQMRDTEDEVDGPVAE